MKRYYFITVILTLIFVAVFLIAKAEETKKEEKPKPTYVGMKKCVTCHKSDKICKVTGDVVTSYNATKHAKAMSSLKDEEKKKEECVKCHTTGYGKGGYKIGAENASSFENVQCEACHGPGSLYSKADIMKDRKKSIENGLIIPDEKTCTQCHNKNSPTFKEFNYEKALKTGVHKLTKKEESKKE